MSYDTWRLANSKSSASYVDLLAKHMELYANGETFGNPTSFNFNLLVVCLLASVELADDVAHSSTKVAEVAYATAVSIMLSTFLPEEEIETSVVKEVLCLRDYDDYSKCNALIRLLKQVRRESGLWKSTSRDCMAALEKVLRIRGMVEYTPIANSRDFDKALVAWETNTDEFPR